MTDCLFRYLGLLGAIAISWLMSTSIVDADEPWVHYRGQTGPGNGKHIVLISGDEEYRSEEALPMLAKILATHHGFDCTVLFSINPNDGSIDPENQTNIPGIEKLDSADLMIIATRFRELPDEAMKHVDAFVHSGKPIIGLRTATHAFHYTRNLESPFAHYGFASTKWPGGFGQQVLGETWVNHHGNHKVESTRGIIHEEKKAHPLLRGVSDIWGPSDVYGVTHLPADADVLVWGQVLTGMKPTNGPVAGPKNAPMMPLLWTRPFTGRAGKTARIVCTTMGAAVDFQSEGLRRAIVNACYWGLGMDDQIKADANVNYVGSFEPTFYGFGVQKKGVKPADHR
jgi:type 1 glutamine amidotransferase